MSMRKDREITIIRESTTKSSRPVGRLSVSLTELLGDSLDPLMSLHEGVFLNEKRAEMPGSNKNDKKFLDQHPEVRELANGVGRGKTTPFNIDIEGIPDKRIEITNNQNGIPRIYSDSGEARSWRSDKRTTAAMQEPVIEITPAATPSAETGPGDEEDDLSRQVDAEREQSRIAPENDEDGDETDAGAETSDSDRLKTLLPEFDKIKGEDNLSYDQKLDKWLETYNKVLDLSDYDEKDTLKSQASEFIEKLKSDKDSVLKSFEDANSYFLTNLKSITDFLSDDSIVPKSSIMTIVSGERDRLKGGEGGETEGGETEGGETEGGETEGGETEGVPNRDGDIEGSGDGDGTETPPPPTDDAKAVSDYIDQVAAGVETVDLSENRRPLHKRSLVELLYSR